MLRTNTFALIRTQWVKTIVKIKKENIHYFIKMEKIAIYDMAYRRAITLIFFMNILVNEIYRRHYSFKNSKQRKRRGKFVTFVFLLKKDY